MEGGVSAIAERTEEEDYQLELSSSPRQDLRNMKKLQYISFQLRIHENLELRELFFRGGSRPWIIF